MTDLEKLRRRAKREGKLTKLAPESPDAVRERDEAAIDRLYDEKGRRLGNPIGQARP